MNDEVTQSNLDGERFSHASHWYDIFDREFVRESDRAAVILTASLFDNALGNLLKNTLVPNPSASDDLFDGANAPLSTFSAKIAMSYRMGLISSRFTRDLHLIRKIRNEFAHNIHGCTFEDSRVKSRVLELYKDTHQLNCEESRGFFPNGTRGDFMFVSSWMLWSINSDVEHCDGMEEADLEFGYCNEQQIKENNIYQR